MTRLEVRMSLKALYSLLLSRILVIALVSAATLISFNSYRTGEWNISVPLLSGLARWDSGFYMDISRLGYPSSAALLASPGEIFRYSFRPVYPFVLAALRPLLGWMDVSRAELVAGFIWNTLMLGLAWAYLERLTSTLFTGSFARRTLVLLAVFPTTYIFSAIYPGATFLFLTVACLYCMETGNEAPAGALGFLAGLTRPEGFLLAIPLLVKAFQGRRRGRLIGASMWVASSLPAFLAFSYYSGGDALLPITAELTWAKLSPSQLLSLPPLPTGELLPIIINAAVFGVAISFFLVSALKRRTARLIPYYCWAAVLLLAFFLDADVRSWARLVVLVPPLLWFQVDIAQSRPWLFRLLAAAYAVTLCASTVLFAAWYPML